LQANAPALWYRVPEEAGRAVFTGTESLLNQTGISFADLGAFIFCAGPGSMLGTRTVAMALRTWQALRDRPVFSYQSLAIAARHEWAQKSGRGFAVIADARRETWHCQSIAADGTLAALRRLADADLPAGECVTPENFRAWAPLPRPAAVCSYDLAKIFPALGDGDFFTATDTPDAFQHEATAYKKWSAQIHSRASAPAK